VPELLSIVRPELAQSYRVRLADFNQLTTDRIQLRGSE
jgi:hypothetical protein